MSDQTHRGAIDEHEHLWAAITDESDVQLEWVCEVCRTSWISATELVLLAGVDLLVIRTPPGFVVRGRRPRQHPGEPSGPKEIAA